MFPNPIHEAFRGYRSPALTDIQEGAFVRFLKRGVTSVLKRDGKDIGVAIEQGTKGQRVRVITFGSARIACD